MIEFHFCKFFEFPTTETKKYHFSMLMPIAYQAPPELAVWANSLQSLVIQSQQLTKCDILASVHSNTYWQQWALSSKLCQACLSQCLLAIQG